MSDMTVSYDVKELLSKSEAHQSVQLARIEGKLDGLVSLLGTKADRADVENLRKTVHDLERKGSDHAQEALRGVHEVDKSLDTVKLDMARKAGIDETELRFETNEGRIWWGIAALFISVMGIVLGVLNLLARNR